VLGDDHSATLDTARSLAEAVGQRGSGRRRRLSSVRLLEPQHRVLGEDDRDTLTTTRSCLAVVVAGQRRWGEAAADLRELLEARRRGCWAPTAQSWLQ
jgi:hypothetical protein